MAENVGAEEDAYAEKFSYRASAWGDVVQEVFLSEAYMVTINNIFLFDVLLVMI